MNSRLCSRIRRSRDAGALAGFTTHYSRSCDTFMPFHNAIHDDETETQSANQRLTVSAHQLSSFKYSSKEFRDVSPNRHWPCSDALNLTRAAYATHPATLALRVYDQIFVHLPSVSIIDLGVDSGSTHSRSAAARSRAR